MTTILAELFVGESPCDDCQHVARCSAEKLDCRPFFDWSSLRPLHRHRLRPWRERTIQLRAMPEMPIGRARKVGSG